MRVLGLASAAAVLLLTMAACGGHGSGVDATGPTTGNSAGDASAAEEAQLKSIAQLFVNDVLTGQSSEAFVLMSQDCQARTSAVTFGALVEKLAARTGSPLPFKSFEAKIHGDRAVASYTFSDHRLDTKKDRWTREADGWRWDSCPGDATGSSQ